MDLFKINVIIINTVDFKEVANIVCQALFLPTLFLLDLITVR